MGNSMGRSWLRAAALHLGDEVERDRAAAQVEEHEDEEGDVAQRNRHVEQVNQLAG